MLGYWARAEARFEGKIVDQGQIAIWAPFYHYILAEFFKYLAYFGALEYKHEAILVLNVVCSTLSLIPFYLIVYNVSKSKRASFAALMLYAFNFILIDFNTFILIENLAIPLLVFAVYLLFVHSDKYFMILFAGIIFGSVVGLRPALGLIGISCVFYIFFTCGKNIKSVIRTMLFIIGFLIIISLIMIENYHVSGGKMKSLSAHGGANFALAQCRMRRLTTHYDGYTWTLSPPIFNEGNDFSRREIYEAPVPFYNQKYYYRLGFACLKLHPENRLENLKMIKALFWGPLFPFAYSIKWIAPGNKIFSYIIFLMFISLGLLYCPIKDKKLDSRKILFLLSIPLWIMLVGYFYASAQRQMLPAYFAIYTMFFALLTYIKHYELQALKYFGVLLLIYILPSII
ncbi:MAG: glycosyltransferase family 39 protein [Candidatus Melainabacteria bacterium]|nr:glycosyltransferase family 39 protein [Candidatus Melainabacteria bacterium]MBI3309271.1 glycosyltransferase family 39 protein [Candidatus Melainabacteria bacterium]